MANNWYPVSVLSGGGTGALDALDGDALNDGDRAIVITTTYLYTYTLDATSGAAESSPDVIAPDSNPGTKRWLLTTVYFDDILPDYAVFDFTAASTAPTLGASADRCYIIADDSEIAGTCTDTLILGGTGNYIEDSVNCAMLACTNSYTDTTLDMCTILSGYDCYIATSVNCSIVSGESQIIDTATGSAILTGQSNQLVLDTYYSAVITGYNCIIDDSSYCLVGCGDTNYIDTCLSSSIIGGTYNTLTSADHALIGSGTFNDVTAEGGVVIGGEYGLAHLLYQEAFASGRFAADGDAQRSTLQVMLATTDATPAILLINGTAPILIPASRSWRFKAEVIARQTAGAAGTVGDSAFWTISGGIKRDGSNNTTLIGTPSGHGIPGSTDSDTAAAAWDVTVTADNANEYLVFTATGEASKTIHWAAKIELVEVG